MSSNIAIVGTLFGGGKKFELSNVNSANLNVGDLVVDNSPTPKLTRVVQKVSEVFSFIGGIVGAVSGLLFVINKYTDFSLEVMIARVIFRGK